MTKPRRHEIDDGPVLVVLSRVFADPLVRAAHERGVTVEFLVREILAAEMRRWDAVAAEEGGDDG